MATQTISKAFKDFLLTLDFGFTFGENGNLFIKQVPENAPDDSAWLISTGGNRIARSTTGEAVRQWFITVYMRSTDAEKVDDNLFLLGEAISDPNCLELNGFEVYDTPEVTSFPSDQDVDNVDRSVGLLQVNIKTYKRG